jgi:hypothetical protein
MQREGKHYRYKNLEFWAQRGLIIIVDRNRADDSTKHLDEYAKQVPPRDFIKRAIAARITGKDFYPSEDRLLSRMLEDATAAVKEAIAQGDPLDPAVQAHVARHTSRGQILMPGEVDAILGPIGGAKFKFDPKDPAVTLRDGETVRPDFSVSPREVLAATKKAAQQHAQLKQRKLHV